MLDEHEFDIVDIAVVEKDIAKGKQNFLKLLFLLFHSSHIAMLGIILSGLLTP